MSKVSITITMSSPETNEVKEFKKNIVMGGGFPSIGTQIVDHGIHMMLDNVTYDSETAFYLCYTSIEIPEKYMTRYINSLTERGWEKV